MCIHPQVSKMSNKDELCKKLNKEKTSKNDYNDENSIGGGCEYLRRFRKNPLIYENYGFKEPVWDIEDILVAFKKKRVRFLFLNF